MIKYLHDLSLTMFIKVHEAMSGMIYPPECCSNTDCKPVPCDAVYPQPDGTWLYEGMKFTKEMVKASLDSACHACYSTNVDSSGSFITRCLFVQLGM